MLRHIRNGTELQPIDVNRNYDFDFQQTNSIPEVQILPVSIYLCIAIATNIKYSSSSTENVFQLILYYFNVSIMII